LGRPYMRVFAHENVFGESRISWTCCAPLTSHLLSQAKIWVLDCTFNEIKDSKETFYLMNIVFYNDILDRCKSHIHFNMWKTRNNLIFSVDVPGPRIRLNGKATTDYEAAIRQLMVVLTNDVPNFVIDNLEELVVDFELAVPKALESLFGKEFTTSKVKGCEVRAPANGGVPHLT